MVRTYFEKLIDKINYIENLRFGIEYENVMQLFVYFLNQNGNINLLIAQKLLEIIKEII